MTEAPELGRRTPPALAGFAAGLRRVVRGLAVGSAFMAGVALIFVMMAVVIDVFSRNTRGRSVTGLVEYVEIVLVLVVFLAFAYTQSRREHVAVEAVVNRLKGMRYRIVVLLAGIAALATIMLFIWATTKLAITAFERREFRLGLAQVPVWPARIAIAYGYVLLGLEYVVTIMEEWIREPDVTHVYDAGPL
jgi:TRAP-type C4-dicarboxylate transport system permease small subunit